MLLNRKQIIYIIIVIGVVLVAALLGYVYRAQLNSILNNPESPAAESRTELQIQEQLGELIKGGNFDDCEKIGNAYYETVCVNNIALQLAQERLDVSYCQKIDNKLIPIADCERQVVVKKSIERESVAICDEATDGDVREQCKASFLIGLAYKKNDVSICDREQDSVRRNECVDMYVFQREYVTNSVGFDCGRFSDGDVRRDCVLFAQRYAVRDMQACDGLRSGLFVSHCMMQNVFR